MAKQFLDLSGYTSLVRRVLRQLKIKTPAQLIKLNERDLLALRNCGHKTTAQILQLQAEYQDAAEPYPANPKVASKPCAKTEDVFIRDRKHINKLIIIASVANDMIRNSQKEKNNRNYTRVTTMRFNILKKTLENFIETKIES